MNDKSNTICIPALGYTKPVSYGLASVYPSRLICVCVRIKRNVGISKRQILNIAYYYERCQRKYYVECLGREVIEDLNSKG